MRFKKLDLTNYRVDEDIETICQILDEDYYKLVDRFKIKDINSLSKKDLESIYSFAWDNNINLTDINWQIDKEDYNVNNYLVLSHGSRSSIKGNIRLDVNGDSNDFANGFYCGQNPQQAGMFVAEEPESSLYTILFDQKGLKRIAFNASTDWMIAVAYYRDTLNDYLNCERVKRIVDKVESADYVVAPIADNRMFQLIDSFIAGEITDVQCHHAMSVTSLGYQYVFKKEACLNNLDIIRHSYLCKAEKESYIKKNESESNTSLNKAIVSKNKYKDEGKYIDQLLK